VIRRLLLSIPMALAWMALIAHLSAEAFAVGFVLGFAVLTLLGSELERVTWRRLPDQIGALLAYTLILCRDVWLSGLDVAQKVIQPQMPLRPGIVAVPTQDPKASDTIAALSAHAITITPGELVVDFDGGKTLYVHCLDAYTSSQGAAGAQARRLRLLQRILG
jgi:multicomponent Na+:H+ antiporter subunit E